MKTYNTIVTSKEVEVLNDVVSRCPYEWRANNTYPGSDHLDEFNAKFNRDYSVFVGKYNVMCNF